MSLKLKSRIIVFVLSFLVWIALTSYKDVQEIVAGVIVAFIVSWAAGHFFITTEKQHGTFRRIFAAIRYMFKFFFEMIRANLHVAYIVVHPNLPIKPGIVKIKSNLTKDSALTILTNSITLTPGTLTIDINPDTKEIYIHWIDVLSTKIEENTQNIGQRFEPLLTEVFE